MAQAAFSQAETRSCLRGAHSKMEPEWLSTSSPRARSLERI